MKTSTKGVPTHAKRFQRAVERLIGEVFELRQSFAAISARGRFSTSNLYLQVTASALQSDVLIRLIRIFESGQTASFWYLHRCEPTKVSQGIDIAGLRNFSGRLKSARDKVFVHIDMVALFDPQKIYQAANINWNEIKAAIEATWTVLNRLYREQNGKEYRPELQTTLDSLIIDFRRDFKAVAKP